MQHICFYERAVSMLDMIRHNTCSRHDTSETHVLHFQDHFFHPFYDDVPNWDLFIDISNFSKRTTFYDKRN